MFSINVKGERNPRDLEMVKLRLIFFQSGYNRIPKVIPISGRYEEWNQKRQLFDGNTKDVHERNQLILKEKLRYRKIAEKWESSGYDWIPKELAHYFDQRDKDSIPYIRVSAMLDRIAEQFHKQERIKNGHILTSASNAKKYILLKKTLGEFTHNVYRKEFSKYRFRDINESFLMAFVLYLKKRGSQNGNGGGVQGKLKLLHATFVAAKRQGVYNVRIAVFDSVRTKFKVQPVTPKTISPKTVTMIEEMDTSWLTHRQMMDRELFLFSAYVGGMSPVDVCYLRHRSIKGDEIIYERIKCDKIARPVLIDKAKVIIEKYRRICSEYVFPIFTRKHDTTKKMLGRVRQLSRRVNTTLACICESLGIKEHVTWRMARSYFISKMVDEGYHALQIAEQTGNSPGTIHRFYYSHTNKEELRQNMNKVF